MGQISIGGSGLLKMPPLSENEKKTLYKIQHRAKCGIARVRAIIILSVSRRVPCPTTAERLGLSPQYVRRVVHAFLEKGLESISRRYRGGRPQVISEEVSTRRSTAYEHLGL